MLENNHFLNERILKQVADGNSVAWMKDQKEERCGLCTECGKTVPLSELISDIVCDECFNKSI